MPLDKWLTYQFCLLFFFNILIPYISLTVIIPKLFAHVIWVDNFSICYSLFSFCFVRFLLHTTTTTTTTSSNIHLKLSTLAIDIFAQQNVNNYNERKTNSSKMLICRQFHTFLCELFACVCCYCCCFCFLFFTFDSANCKKRPSIKTDY